MSTAKEILLTVFFADGTTRDYAGFHTWYVHECDQRIILKEGDPDGPTPGLPRTEIPLDKVHAYRVWFVESGGGDAGDREAPGDTANASAQPSSPPPSSEAVTWGSGAAALRTERDALRAAIGEALRWMHPWGASAGILKKALGGGE